MKDVYEVLNQKEADLLRVGREIESLRIVAGLLEDDAGRASDRQGRLQAGSTTSTEDGEEVLDDGSSVEDDFEGNSELRSTGTDGQSSPAASRRLWSVLNRRG